MSVKRYELSEAQWEKIAPLPLGKAGGSGRTGSDNRLFANGCLWVLRSGSHWRDLPERYGKWQTVHRRFSRWRHAGVWERVFEMLTADRDNKCLMLDSAIVRVHQTACAICSRFLLRKAPVGNIQHNFCLPTAMAYRLIVSSKLAPTASGTPGIVKLLDLTLLIVENKEIIALDIGRIIHNIGIEAALVAGSTEQALAFCQLERLVLS